MLFLRDKKGLGLGVGDTVYYAEGNEIKEGVITRVRIEVDGKVYVTPKISYGCPTRKRLMNDYTYHCCTDSCIN